MIFFLSFFLKIYCSCIKLWSVRHFLSITFHFIFFVLCMHASYKTSSEMLNIKFISKRLRNMGDQWEAWISSMENILEEFGHDIRERREQLVRLTNLCKNHIKTEAMRPRGPSSLAKSIGPSTIHPNREPSATRNWLPQPAATNAHSPACFHGNISTCRSAKRLKYQI